MSNRIERVYITLKSGEMERKIKQIVNILLSWNEKKNFKPHTVEVYASGNAIDSAFKIVSTVEEDFNQTLHKIVETKLHITEPGEFLTD